MIAHVVVQGSPQGSCKVVNGPLGLRVRGFGQGCGKRIEDVGAPVAEASVGGGDVGVARGAG